jgi:hypothetical protein
MKPTGHAAGRIAAAAITCTAILLPTAALASVGSPARVASPIGTLPTCAASGLVVWLNVPTGNHYAGGADYNLEFTNLSGHACTLRGSPGVSAVNLSDHQLGSPAGRGAIKAPDVRLANGATATADLTMGDPGNYGTRCFPLTTAAGLRVYPPNQTASKVIAYPFTACGQAGPVYMHVAPVRKA